MAIEQSPAHELVSKFEQAKDLPSFDMAFNSAVLMSKSDGNSWKDAQRQLQQTDLASIGLAGFKIDGLDTQPKDTSGYPLAPELNISNSSGVKEHIDQQGNVLDATNTITGALSFSEKTQPAADTEMPLKPADSAQPSSTPSDLVPPTSSPGDVAPSAGPADAPTTFSPADAAPTNSSADAALTTPRPDVASTTPPADAASIITPTDRGQAPPPPGDVPDQQAAGPLDSPPPAPDASDSTTASGTPFGPNGRTMTMSADGSTGVYGIQSGDTLWSIAQDALTAPGQTLTTDQQAAMAPEILALVDQIAQDNNITNPDEIYPGQQLTIRKQTPDAANGTPSDGGAQGAGNTPLSLLNNQLGQFQGSAPSDTSGGSGSGSGDSGSDDGDSGDGSDSSGGDSSGQDDSGSDSEDN